MKFYNPPTALSAMGTKEGVELGGSKLIVSIDSDHNLYNEGTIFSEMSWAQFYQEKGIEDQIDSFTTREFDSIREDPEALIETIIKSINSIINQQKIFYGIADFEVDAFLNKNTVIPGLKLDYEVINKLLDAHKKSREKDLFPNVVKDARGKDQINIEIHGEKKNNLRIMGKKLEDLINKLRLAKGFATGIVCSSKKVANLYILSDNIVFTEDKIPELYIDQENLNVIEYGINKKRLFPISWFRIDIGIRSLETLELWDKIKDDEKLQKALDYYDRYIIALVYKKFKNVAQPEKIGSNLNDDFYQMSPRQRRKALRDMADAIKILTEKYKE